MFQQHLPPQYDKLSVSAASCSDIGRVRVQNEDAIVLCEPSDPLLLAQLGKLYLLADGAGGHAAGEVASKTAVDTIAAAYYRLRTADDKSDVAPYIQGEIKHLNGSLYDLELPGKQLIHSFRTAHQKIRQLAAQRQDYAGMVTTCLAVVVRGKHVLVAHIGDSRAYLVHPSSQPSVTIPATRCLTTDHSMATVLAKMGAMPVEFMQSSPSRHILVRALGEGAENPVGPDVTTCVVNAGDKLVLCCDGLWSNLAEEQISLVASTYAPQAACNELVRLANEAGGEDNISVVLVSFQ